MKSIAFFDLETSQEKNGGVMDIGCIRSDEAILHQNSIPSFFDFVKETEFICGHNVVLHDLKYLQQQPDNKTFGVHKVIDTLLLSPLLFPKRPYHHLVKDYKLQSDELNNPLNDAKIARALFEDEIASFSTLDGSLKSIFYSLLHGQMGFAAFFRYVGYAAILDDVALENHIRDIFQGRICFASDIKNFIENHRVPLAYALSLINVDDRHSIVPHWVLHQYPDVERIVFLMRNSPCISGCSYCNKALDPILALKRYFGFPSFRRYDGRSLQHDAVAAAVDNRSILAVFPTGGGKSITFQVPALMSGENTGALTVVISPLQSLMKDQVDNLEKKGIVEAATINGLLDPIERAKAIERVENGNVCLLYIAPESLRSVTIERLLLKRKIARFVIDEAHCFSSWGQDFRVDYLYIGDFIKLLQEKKNLPDPIPVSCFTATAKLKVIEDITQYFKEKLGLDLVLFRANVARNNLQYQVFNKAGEEEKYNHLRSIIESKDCPVIVYVSRTRKAYQLAQRLSEDGFNAKPYHGKMDKDEKVSNQTAFMSGEVNIMVATSAFGMGVDKENVGLVLHYDISDSLENYVQEAGRAGRDENISAECYIFFNEDDLDKHFILHNQTKMSVAEINQIWKAIKDMTRIRSKVSSSALEIARKAGWDDNVKDIETRVTTAIAALEGAKYIKRGQNMPRVFANGILSANAQEAMDKINISPRMDERQKEYAGRIIRMLISSKSRRSSPSEVAESRVDYIADQLGIKQDEVVRVITLLKEDKILADTKDLVGIIRRDQNRNHSMTIANSYNEIEEMLWDALKEGEAAYNVKELNELAEQRGIENCTPHKIKTIINFWAIRKWIDRRNLEHSRHHFQMICRISKQEMRGKIDKRHLLARTFVEYLFGKAEGLLSVDGSQNAVVIEFSVHELKEAAGQEMSLFAVKPSVDDVEDTLFYLSRIESLKIEGGFLVTYNRLSIDRIEKNNRIKYKEGDHEKLNQHYHHKVQQIHIIGEYAKRMIQNYNEALQFVEDYFNLNYASFLNRYFPGSRQDEIKRSITPEKFRALFGALSTSQLKIIKDADNKYIVVAAGPGSGKTRVLVHKLASILLTEDVKHEQLLMLTFSRAAATEFKARLLGLIGSAANYVEIKTFHSYCFDLLGKVGSLPEADAVISTAVKKIRDNEIEISRITKNVLVIDEAQDISLDEYELIKGLIDRNEEMRVILVGDDDQNIFSFRGADAKFMQQLTVEKEKSVKYELIENFRSKSEIVAFANQWIHRLPQRLKHEPGVSMVQGKGIIEIVEHAGGSLLEPMADAAAQTGLSGTSCILTQTNEEAVQLKSLLILKGLDAKVIQSNDGFNLLNLYELRCFSDMLQLDDESPFISEETWAAAERQFDLEFSRSNKRELVQTVIRQFTSVNPVRKYKSDWKAFLVESKMEDFPNIDTETIYISTVHKAKGKEFDNVFILLDRRFNPASEENIRQLFVAATRAKTRLVIHYTGDYLRRIHVERLQYHGDPRSYSDPVQMAIVLTHRDVRLGYFAFVQRRINGMLSGDALTILEEGLGNSKNELVIKFSQRCKELMAEKLRNGYLLAEARVNFIVYWKDQEQVEVKIILPEVLLKKSFTQ